MTFSIILPFFCITYISETPPLLFIVIEGVVNTIENTGSLNGTRVAVVTFNSAATLKFGLTKHQSTAALKTVSIVL